MPERHAPDIATFTFLPLTPDDFAQMHRWRNSPAVREWWDPVPTLAEIVAKYAPRIAGEEPVRPFIARCDGVTMGFLQWCRLAEVPGHAAENMAEPGAAAVDLYIGEDEYRGRGYGAAMLRTFLREVVFAPPDVTACYIDPHPKNAVAIRSYARAGFRDLGVVQNDAAGDPAWLMVIGRGEVLDP
jgi:RimJ/RimL family protein N-acetyltransferase